jgi:hypothetical protein
MKSLLKRPCLVYLVWSVKKIQLSLFLTKYSAMDKYALLNQAPRHDLLGVEV